MSSHFRSDDYHGIDDACQTVVSGLAHWRESKSDSESENRVRVSDRREEAIRDNMD